MFSLKLFGGTSLEGPDGPLTGRAAQRHRLALLALLATARNGGTSREKLIAYLWAETEAERGRHLLSNSLYVLRQALGEEAILGTGEGVRLNPERIRCDVREFEEAIEREDFERAVALYAGPFLDGFFLADTPEFERWVDAEREQYARSYAAALERLAEDREAEGDFRIAAEWWRRLAAHDRYCSRVVLRLMQALETAGDRAAALQHAQAHTALLHEEFGAAPDPEILALAERLRAEPLARAIRNGRAEAAEDPSGIRRNGAETSHAAGVAPVLHPSDEQLPLPGSFPELSSLVTQPLPRKPQRGWTALVALAERRPKRVVVVAAVLGAAILASLSLGIIRGGIGNGGLLGAGTLEQGDQVIVAEFENQTSDSLLASVVTDALRIDLRQSRVVHVAGTDQVREALIRMQRRNAVLTPELAREIAIREGIKAVVNGSVGEAGTGYILSAHLLAAESGEELIVLRETAADSTDLLSAIERLSDRLRRKIGEPLRTIRASAPLDKVTTTSLAALRKFSGAGQAAFAEGDFDRAILLAEEAVALDTAFAAGWTSLPTADTQISTGCIRAQEVSHGRETKAVHAGVQG